MKYTEVPANIKIHKTLLLEDNEVTALYRLIGKSSRSYFSEIGLSETESELLIKIYSFLFTNMKTL